MPEVNFVRERRKQLNKTQQQDRRILKFTLLGAASVAVVAMSVVGAQLFLTSQVKSMLDDIESARASILANEEVESSYVVLLHKLKTIEELFFERKDRQQAIEFFTNIFGDQAMIEKMRYESTSAGRLLNFTILSADVFSLEQVLATLSSPQVKSKYPVINTSGLSRTQYGDYGLEVTVALDETGSTTKKP